MMLGNTLLGIIAPVDTDTATVTAGWLELAPLLAGLIVLAWCVTMRVT